MKALQQTFNQLRDRWARADRMAVHLKARKIVATAATVTILLPWLPVGESAAMSGSRLLSYGIASPELGQWMPANPLGTVLFVGFGAAMVVTCLAMAWTVIRDGTATGHLLFLIAAPIAVIMAAQNPIFDQAVPRMGIVPVPQWGLSTLMAACAALLAQTWYLKRLAAQQREREE